MIGARSVCSSKYVHEHLPPCPCHRKDLFSDQELTKKKGSTRRLLQRGGGDTARAAAALGGRLGREVHGARRLRDRAHHASPRLPQRDELWLPWFVGPQDRPQLAALRVQRRECRRSTPQRRLDRPLVLDSRRARRQAHRRHSLLRTLVHAQK